MIAFLRGRVLIKEADAVILDVQGVGYRLFASAATLAELPPPGGEAVLHTYLHVREDALALYGFCRAEEERLFRTLLGVSGIGPKMALGILSGATPESLGQAIAAQDAAALARLPGVGRKLAQRLIVELRDALAGGDLWPAGGVPAAAVAPPGGLPPGGVPQPWQEARLGLLQLGYSALEADRALSEALQQLREAAADRPAGAAELSTEELLRAALHRLAGPDAGPQPAAVSPGAPALPASPASPGSPVPPAAPASSGSARSSGTGARRRAARRPAVRGG